MAKGRLKASAEVLAAQEIMAKIEDNAVYTVPKPGGGTITMKGARLKAYMVEMRGQIDFKALEDKSETPTEAAKPAAKAAAKAEPAASN